MARYSQAHNRATQKWRNANRYRINVYFFIEWKEIILERAKEFGSVNAYLNYLVKQDLGLPDSPKED